ncbi:MAG: DUF4038 domain-containing protein [Mediterraneibacter gnavus]
MKAWEYGKLRVSDNRKYLCNGDRPFFWLGDTAWLMFAKLTEEEAAVYLRNRKEKGYTVIQSTLIHEWPQKNRDGANALYKEHQIWRADIGIEWNIWSAWQKNLGFIWLFFQPGEAM